MILSEEEFISYYQKHHRFPNGSYINPEKMLNRNQLISKYKKYVSSIDRKEIKSSQIKSRMSEKVSVKMSEIVRKKPPKKSKPRSDYTKSVDAAIAEAKRLDPEGRVFWESLSEEERELVSSQISGNPILQILDGAHIISRTQCKELAAEVDNIIILPRFIHAAIDGYRNPFVPGCPHISKEERDTLWVRIVGEERWGRLWEKAGKLR